MTASLYKKTIMKKRIILYCALSAVLIVILLITAIYNGIILLNNPSKKDFPVRGVDVSSYQGNIDWKTIKAQDIQFAFIKATEGSSLVDKYFESNYKKIKRRYPAPRSLPWLKGINLCWQQLMKRLTMLCCKKAKKEHIFIITTLQEKASNFEYAIV